MSNSSIAQQAIILVALASFSACALPPHGEPIPTSRRPAAIPSDAGLSPGTPSAAPQAVRVAHEAPTDLPDTPKSIGVPASDGVGSVASPAAAVVPAPTAQDLSVRSVATKTESASNGASDPFAGLGEVSADQLVAEVQARNPSLQAAVAAWSAAAQRYPQQVSLEDPMFEYMIGPGGVGAMDGGGWMVAVSQKFPWPGKRDLRGNAASAEAIAVQADMGDTKLRLAEMTRTAYADYFLAYRMTEVHAANHKLLTQFREIARNKYVASQATEQDLLQADVELANLHTHAFDLSRDTLVAKARINTLMHRMPDCPLPPPSTKLAQTDRLPEAAALQRLAERSRPDLYAAGARARAEEANLALACKEYYPDIAVVAKYDGFMPDDMRAQVGMQMNVPLQNSRRRAAVREAEARVEQRRWEYQNLLDSVRFEVQSAHDRAAQSREMIRLYEEHTLPLSQRNVDSAFANYTSGKLDFLRLLDAQRQFYSQREMHFQAIAEYHRRLAELERAVGEEVR